MKFSEFKSKKQPNKSEVFDKTSENLLRSFVTGYEGKTQEEIIAEIIKVAEKNRREGKLSDADLDNFKATLTPMLNDVQKRELDKIIARLKTK